MNIYDFDGTLYNGDSNVDIIKYSITRYPIKLVKSLIKANKLNKEYKKGNIDFEPVKEALLSFIFEIPNYENYIDKFVDSHFHKINKFYFERHTSNDMILSASYNLWIEKFAKKLNIEHVICTKVDNHGKIVGKNCKENEKVNRLKEEIKDVEVENAYGDSSKDIPVLKLAKHAFVVEKGQLFDYKDGYDFKFSK